MQSAKFTLYLLLLGSWFPCPRWPQCSSLSSSGLPNLPSDTIAELPANQRSEKLRKLFRKANHSTRLRIRFTQLPAGVRNTSAVETTQEENIVALRQNLTPEQEENSIAHELLHVILQGEGFAAEVHTPENASRLMAQLGHTITSCVDDAVVDRRMLKLGFKPELLNHDTAEQMKLNPPRFSSMSFDDPIVVDGNALLIVCFNFRRKYQNDEIETSWRELNPDVVARSRVLAAQIGDITCEDANTCLTQKKHIRDILGLPITFCNPLTRTYE